MKVLNISEIQAAIKAHTLLIDTRPTAVFVDGYLKGAINIIINEHFEARADFFSKNEKSFILIADPEKKEIIEAIEDENLLSKLEGVFYGKFEDWQAAGLPIDLIINVDAYELNLDIKHDEKALVMDVRSKLHYDEEHIVGAVNMQMTDFNDHAKISVLDEQTNFYLHCNGGTSSVLIASVLKRNGYHNLRNIEGGFKAVLADGNIPTHSNNKKSQN